MSAIGIIETTGYVNTFTALVESGDAGFLKLIFIDKNIGRFLVCSVIEGPISEVQVALEMVERKFEEGTVVTSCIGNPHPQLVKWLKATDTIGMKSKL